MRRQAELLKQQISGLETLFLTASNVDTDREDIAPMPVISALAVEDTVRHADATEQLLDANERISDLEDQVARLANELSAAKDELLLRPAIAPDAPQDAKDAKIASLEKMIRELECVLQDNDIEEAVKRERRLMDREYLSRLRALERDILVRKELETKANEVLAGERKVGVLPPAGALTEPVYRKRRSWSGSSSITSTPKPTGYCGVGPPWLQRASAPTCLRFWTKSRTWSTLWRNSSCRL
jgi:hypothetical protein